jgi:uncharacterized membrane protein YhaH (DUF805 family)
MYIEDYWQYSLYLGTIAGILYILKKIKNWKISLIFTIIPLTLFTFLAIITKIRIFYSISGIFLLATGITIYLVFSSYKDWKQYNSSLHVQAGYDPELTFLEFYSQKL